VPDIAASGRPQENRITGRAGTLLSTPELAELETYIAKSEYLADLAIECGFHLAAYFGLVRLTRLGRGPSWVKAAGNLAPRPSSAGVIAVRSSR
jgi:hypothetical protein